MIRLALAALLLLAAPLPAAAETPQATAASSASAGGRCLPAGAWHRAGGEPVAPADALLALASARIVLLGETHATPAHHRWQADIVRALSADGRPLVIALEQLARAAQPALDGWVAGKLDEAAFLEASDWKRAWGHDFAAYRPLFALAREQRIPMLAVNIDRAFVRAVSREGFEAARRAHGNLVGHPAPPPEDYVAMLRGAFAMHGKPPDEAALERFVLAQASWDRAMAEGIAEALAARPEARVVAMMGYGHILGGHGVAHQLRALGHARIASAIPVNAAPPCPVPDGAADFLAGTGEGP
jgi:uncharacterized iron-regulated protein